MAETFTGTIERVTHHNPETGYAVLRVLSRGRRGVATVVGKLLAVTAGEKLEAKGSWVADPQYGEQFRADEIKLLPPTTAEGIEKYLASGLVKGIGPKYAKKITVKRDGKPYLEAEITEMKVDEKFDDGVFGKP